MLIPFGPEGTQVRTRTIFLFCILMSLVYAFRTSPEIPFVLGEDSATYVTLSQSLLQGKGLSSLWVVSQPPHAKAPFGFPLMLAPVIALWGVDTGLLTYAMTAFACLVFLAVFLYFRRIEGTLVAFIITLACVFNGGLYLYGRSILSEVPYLFWSALSLWLLHRVLSARQPSAGQIGLLALCFLMAFFTRTIGVLILITGLFSLSLSKGPSGQGRVFRQFRWFLPLIVLSTVWWFFRLWVVSEETSVSYIRDFTGGNYNRSLTVESFLWRMIEGAYALMFYAIPKVLTNVTVSARSWPMALVSIVAAGGWFWSAWHKRRVLDFYVFIYIFLACCWPWVPVSGFRFIFPLVPFLLYYFYVGVREGVNLFCSGPQAKSLRRAVLGILFVLYAWQSPVLRPGSFLGEDPVLGGPYTWIKQHISQDAVFAGWTPISLFVCTGRQSADFASSTFNADHLEQLLIQGKIDFVLDDTSMEQSVQILSPVRAKYPAVFQEVYKAQHFQIFAIDKSLIEHSSVHGSAGQSL